MRTGRWRCLQRSLSPRYYPPNWRKSTIISCGAGILRWLRKRSTGWAGKWCCSISAWSSGQKEPIITSAIPIRWSGWWRRLLWNKIPVSTRWYSTVFLFIKILKWRIRCWRLSKMDGSPGSTNWCRNAVSFLPSSRCRSIPVSLRMLRNGNIRSTKWIVRGLFRKSGLGRQDRTIIWSYWICGPIRLFLSVVWPGLSPIWIRTIIAVRWWNMAWWRSWWFSRRDIWNTWPITTGWIIPKTFRSKISPGSSRMWSVSWGLPKSWFLSRRSGISIYRGRTGTSRRSLRRWNRR